MNVQFKLVGEADKNGIAPIRMIVTEIGPALRRVYRCYRQSGLDRDTSNLLTIGYGDGVRSVRDTVDMYSSRFLDKIIEIDERGI